LIDRFIDALWLEDGLAANSLAAYRRDLQQLSVQLGGRDLLAASEADLQRYSPPRSLPRVPAPPIAGWPHCGGSTGGRCVRE